MYPRWLENQSPKVYYAKISGGACPQIPLVYCALRAQLVVTITCQKFTRTISCGFPLTVALRLKTYS